MHLLRFVAKWIFKDLEPLLELFFLKIWLQQSILRQKYYTKQYPTQNSWKWRLLHFLTKLLRNKEF